VPLFGKKVGNIEGITVYESSMMGTGYNSAGIALPGYGIIVAPGAWSKKQSVYTVRHEFGHFLQARKTGWIVFYLCIGIPSLLSAWLKGFGKGHSNFWTEVWCNHLVQDYFKDDEWPIHHMPCRELSPKSKFWLIGS